MASGGESHYDVIVIGSGFGGSVAALRATEKGYFVGVLEFSSSLILTTHAGCPGALQ